MAKTKSVRTTKKAHKMIDTQTENLIPETPMVMRRPLPFARIALVVLALGLAAILFANKGLIIAATVNGKPIFRWDLNKQMTARFGAQTLEGMISEELIAGEAQKAGVTVTKDEVDAKVQSVVASLGGNVSIDDLLKYQGMTKAEFENQIRLQLMVEKLLGKDIAITDEDIAAYIAGNGATLTATDEAGMKEEARQAILSGKINDKLQTWFAELKANAKIFKFL